MESDTANNVADDVRGIGGLALEAGEEALDRASKVLLGDTKDDLGLLAAGLGEVEFEDRLEVVRDDTLSDEVNVLKSLDVTPFFEVSVIAHPSASHTRSFKYLKGLKLASLTILPNLARSLVAA